MSNLEQAYLEVKQQILEKEFEKMNPMQRQAVFQTEGPVLILAGAGSGKTTVVVNRIANMIQYGSAYHSAYVPPFITKEDVEFLRQYTQGVHSDLPKVRELIANRPVKPWNILAITFTNKAAGELKERLERILGEDALDIQASTFHSACVRILRREIEALGYSRNFTIYDTDDSLRVIKEGLKALQVNEKNITPKSVLGLISSAKDRFEEPKQLLQNAQGDYRLEITAKVYDYYQKRLKDSNAVDFDDIIILTVKLFQQFPDVLDHYQNRFKYIMVDEYQDTNNSQFLLVSLLAQRNSNICVVGDDDQSIYKFRGATIENILNFENQYPNTKVIRLEQNYRCTQKILDAANAVIANNTQRKGKTLWTKNGEGAAIEVHRALDEQGEARFIADSILDNVKNGAKFSDHAILYRMNAQSNTIENALVRSGITYRMIGGLRFYERKEIKDVLSYLSVINNPNDAIRLKRIINEPKRGLGDATVEKAQEIGETLGLSLFQVMAQAEEYQPLARKAKPLEEFTQMIDRLAQQADSGTLEELFDALMEETGYRIYLRSLGEEGIARLENVEELKSNLMKYDAEAEEPSLAGFLEEVTLYTDLDNYDPNADNVVMMTMHSAKGLEFENVFFCGAEEGIFPGIQAMYNPEQIEEERRLAYVCITRAKKQLYISTAAQRMIFGQTVRNRPSRFVREIPQELCHLEDKTLRKKVVQTEPAPAQNRFKNRASNNIGVGAASPAPAAGACNLSVGQRVKHRTFGEGMVANITPMGGDSLLEIIFDQVGAKKIMYKFAKLEKLS